METLKIAFSNEKFSIVLKSGYSAAGLTEGKAFIVDNKTKQESIISASSNGHFTFGHGCWHSSIKINELISFENLQNEIKEFTNIIRSESEKSFVQGMTRLQNEVEF